MAKKLTAYLLPTFIGCVFSCIVAAQTYLLPPNQPEQDACGALSLCGSKFSTPYSYQGNGLANDLTIIDNCGSTEGEFNSVWMKLQVSASGTIVFSIIPVDPLDDYDFAVANTTTSGCSKITQSNVVRYNFNNNEPNTNPGGVVGLSASATSATVCGGVSGSPFCQYINAVAGETYLVMINNFGHDDSPGPSKGFTIDFTGSTASFIQTPPPAFASINSVLCANTTTVTLQLTKPVLCSSIAADGSDFSITPHVAISSATGVNCTGNNGYANAININFVNPPAAGNYTVNAQQGSDGNTLLGLCNNPLTVPSSISFTVLSLLNKIDTEHICFNQLPYVWNGIKVSQGGSNVATFATKSVYGCDSTVVLNLTVSNPPGTSSSSKTICGGQLYQLPWNDSTITTAGVYTHTYSNVLGCDSLTTTITVAVDNPSQNFRYLLCNDSTKALSIGAGFTNYVWGNGATTPSILVNQAGNYTVQATDALGCIASDTFTVSTDVITDSLAKNITLCQGSTLKITVTGGFVSYVWSDGTTQPAITITSPGTYWLTVTDTVGCQATDTAIVVSVPIPTAFLTGSITKCFYSTITLHALNTYSAYLWGTGATTPAISVLTPGTYSLQVTDANGCVGLDSVKVIDSACPEYLYIPTAFTPNGDNRNDVFKPAFAGVATHYTFIVYNRWGQKVFSSNNPADGWDGNINGQPQPSGVYIWQCQYQLFERQPLTQKGTVVLVR